MRMRILGGFVLPAIATMMMLGSGRAQNVGDQSVYFLTYYSNALHTSSAPDSTLRIINDGDSGANLWASFYVFDDSQEMNECCSCPVTPDGLTSESINTELTNNTLTSRLSSCGVIKIISSSVAAGGPENYTNTPTPGLRVWATHLQGSAPRWKNQQTSSYITTETAAADSNLASGEETLLETLCLYINLLGGSHQGVCSCTPEDSSF